MSVIAGFSLLGIMIGVATLIIVLSVMNGFRAELLERIIGVHGHIWVIPNGGSEFKDMHKALEIITASKGVTLAQPAVERQAVLMHGGQARGLQIHGMRLQDLQKRPIIASNIKAGALDTLKDGQVLVGKRLADLLGLHIHDRITLLNPVGTQTAFGTTPKQRAFEVAAIYEIGMNEYDKNVLFMTLASAQSFFNMKDNISSIEIFVKDMENAITYSQNMQDALGQNYQALNWQHGNSPFFQAVEIERDVMFLILTLIILIAAFNIISSLIMLVKDKTKDIAILRTMGATRSSIMKTFFITGASIGIVGTLLGLALGVLVTKNLEEIRQFIQNTLGMDLFNVEVYHLTRFPSKMDAFEVCMVVSMGLFLSFLATLYPSWKASKLHPVEALRQ